MRVWTIPVAFAVQGETEEKAAYALLHQLVATNIITKSERPDAESQIECWWMPNHPNVDGSDADAPRLEFRERAEVIVGTMRRPLACACVVTRDEGYSQDGAICLCDERTFAASEVCTICRSGAHIFDSSGVRSM